MPDYPFHEAEGLKYLSQQAGWHFYQYYLPQAQQYYLYAQQFDDASGQQQALHLGVFATQDALWAQRARFLEEPQTTLALPLAPDSLELWLRQPNLAEVPRFIGQFGSQWSGYGIKPVDERQVEVIYAADLRHEWLGVFTEVEAFAFIELDYDRRRRRCLIC